METCSSWRRGKKYCSPEACRCKGRCGRVAATPGGSPSAAAAPHLNPVKPNGVGWLHSGGVIGNVSLWPAEEGRLNGDGLSDTSASITNDPDVEEDGYSDFSVDSNSDGGTRPWKTFTKIDCDR